MFPGSTVETLSGLWTTRRRSRENTSSLGNVGDSLKKNDLLEDREFRSKPFPTGEANRTFVTESKCGTNVSSVRMGAAGFLHNSEFRFVITVVIFCFLRFWLVELVRATKCFNFNGSFSYPLWWLRTFIRADVKKPIEIGGSSQSVVGNSGFSFLLVCLPFETWIVLVLRIENAWHDTNISSFGIIFSTHNPIETHKKSTNNFWIHITLDNDDEN